MGNMPVVAFRIIDIPVPFLKLPVFPDLQWKQPVTGPDQCIGKIIFPDYFRCLGGIGKQVPDHFDILVNSRQAVMILIAPKIVEGRI